MNSEKSHLITKREEECLFWLSNGLTAKEIAREMKISHRTVEYHISHVRIKTNIQRRSHLISLYKDIFDRRLLLGKYLY